VIELILFNVYLIVSRPPGRWLGIKLSRVSLINMLAIGEGLLFLLLLLADYWIDRFLPSLSSSTILPSLSVILTTISMSWSRFRFFAKSCYYWSMPSVIDIF
jgi:hypothetical protein